MKMEELLKILDQIGIPFAYHHWEKPPPLPYGVYLYDSTDNFGADDKVYLVIESAQVEIYTTGHDQALQDKTEAVLEANQIYWDRDTAYIESERMYQTVYEIEV